MPIKIINHKKFSNLIQKGKEIILSLKIQLKTLSGLNDHKIPHHLIDVASLDTPVRFSANDFVTQANAAIDVIFSSKFSHFL